MDHVIATPRGAETTLQGYQFVRFEGNIVVAGCSISLVREGGTPAQEQVLLAAVPSTVGRGGIFLTGGVVLAA